METTARRRATDRARRNRGRGGARLGAGVVMHLKAKREGLMLSLGADVVDIRMSP